MERTELTDETVRAIIDLGKFALAFGRVDRITCHPDGTTPESDSDHTVMLGLVACSFAERFAPGLDRGKIAEYALVHDLVEVYAGDTATARIMSEGDHQDKAARETVALKRIRKEFDEELPWIGETIESYESLDTPEARFVKVVDKTLPKITNILNGGVTFKGQGHDAATGSAFLSHQQDKLGSSYGKDQSEALALLHALSGEMMKAIF